MRTPPGSRAAIRPDSLVARPLPPPEEFDAPRRRRWELFAPALAACLREALQRACEALFDEAGDTPAGDRRRLAFASATELAGRAQTLDGRCRAALIRLFVDAPGLTEAWQADVGAFALGQCSERLLRNRSEALIGLHRRLQRETLEDASPVADALAGLLAATFETDRMAAHARNVLCTTWCRRLETVLPGLAGAPETRALATDAEPAALDGGTPSNTTPARRPVPRPVLDALTRLQLLALERPLGRGLVARVTAHLASTRTPFDAAAAERALVAIRAEDERLARLCDERTCPGALARALPDLAPILARVHCEHIPHHPAVTRFLDLLLTHLVDLDEDGRDPRRQVLEDVVGDMLARFRGEVADLEELFLDAASHLDDVARRQLELRRRARERALAERRRVRARHDADTICEHLSERDELVPFVERAWRSALVQAHLRYGPDSVPWRRMLVLGQTLLTAGRGDMETLRPSLADALSLVVTDAVEVEGTLDMLDEALCSPLETPPLLSTQRAATTPRTQSIHRDDLPWLLADGRRRWLLVQARDGGDEVLLGDALGRTLDWMSAETFDAGVDAGDIVPLDARPLLKRYCSR
jgi:hypothetical protein